MATKPLDKVTYLAPKIPNEVLKKTGKGIPYFCEGSPIKLTKKTTNKDANKVPKKTTNILSS